jgi:Mrp family chromosome partitioning ATPase
MSHVDGGRRITALAAGGSVLLLSATAVALWPRTYGTTATFVLDGAPQLGNPIVLAGRIEASLLEREGLAAVAMDLPPELRSPDPIGRLRAGIRVQSRGALGFTVEFRGSDPQSVQRIANHLADRAVKVLPKLASSPVDNAPALALAERSRAVTEFLTAHPEITLEASPGKINPAGDSGLDALRNEKRQIEQRLATGAPDNPYADPAQDPELLNRRLVEIKTTIARREAALKQPRPATPSAVAPELTSQWRVLLAELATAQASASVPDPQPVVSGHVTARAPLPSSPLTPNRLVLSLVAALLTMAAAMIAYVLPRRADQTKRQAPRSAAPTGLGDPPPAPLPVRDGRISDQAPPPAGAARSEPPLRRSEPPSPQRSDPPPGRPISEPPGPIAVQRTVVLSGNSGSAPPPKRSQTSPGGLQAPHEVASAMASTVRAEPPTAHSPPAAPLFGSRPPPGAGSYSVSSSHPPPMGRTDGAKRTSVERLSPLQSAHPPAQPAPGVPSTRRSPLPVTSGDGPQIVSRPPALDPAAEAWAARFDTVPPPAPLPVVDVAEDVPRKRSGRWKTQVMGSMVPLEVSAAREERPPLSEPVSEPVSHLTALMAEVLPAAVPQRAPAPAPAAAAVRFHDVPSSWAPKLEAETPALSEVRDAVLKEASTRRLTIAVTGSAGSNRAKIAASLAFSLAHNGASVLLVEADFDRPELHDALEISAPPGAGFSQQLRGRRPDGQAAPWVVVRCSPNLQVLVEGRMRSPGMLTSGAFHAAIQELRGQHHVVILHAPALAKPGDLRPLTGISNAVVVVNNGQPPLIQFGDGALRGLVG